MSELSAQILHWAAVERATEKWRRIAEPAALENPAQGASILARDALTCWRWLRRYFRSTYGYDTLRMRVRSRRSARLVPTSEAAWNKFLWFHRLYRTQECLWFGMLQAYMRDLEQGGDGHAA